MLVLEVMTIPLNTREAWIVLAEVSKYMQTISYIDLAVEISKLRPDKVQPAAVSLAVPLGYIRDSICIEHRLPWLNALAVNKQTRVPGDSFLPEGSKLPPEQEFLWWRGMVLQVHAYPWETQSVDKLFT